MNIYATLGPACFDKETLCKMIENGMTGVRINTSHGMYQSFSRVLENLSCAEQKTGVYMERLMDMRGPEIRISGISETLSLKEGDTFTIGKDILLVPDVSNKLKKGMICRLNDGQIEAVLISNNECKVIKGGVLSPGKSFAVLGHNLTDNIITESDVINLKGAEKLKINSIMQPFVRSGKDVIYVKNTLIENKISDINVYSKIEDGEGLLNAEEIIKKSDKIVIARGDLGNNTDIYSLPKEQKRLAALCKKHGKRFIVATQLLASMENNETPTRAEINDIYNCALDGADGLMLTGETAIGRYPAEAVKVLYLTTKSAESSL